jgi:hypothetical protein
MTDAFSRIIWTEEADLDLFSCEEFIIKARSSEYYETSKTVLSFKLNMLPYLKKNAIKIKFLLKT